MWVGREEWGEGEIQGEQNRRMQEETRKEQPPEARLCREDLVVKQRTWGTIQDDQIPDPGFFLPPSMGLLSDRR